MGTSVAPLRVWHVRTRSIAPDSIFQRAQDDSDSQISDALVLNVRPRPAARSARAVGEPGVMAHPKTGLSSVLLGRCCLGSSGRDGESDRCDLGCPKTEIFFEMGLDWWKQIDPVQQIRPCAQLRDLAAHEATATDRGLRITEFCATKRQMSGSARRFRPRFRPCRIRTREYL